MKATSSDMYKYDAFISYRHTEPDKSVAKKLQALLENYKPPKSIGGKGKKKLRIFRDESELKSGSDLSKEIKTALECSEFLIVICTNNLPASRWCAEEREYFKELHGGKNDNIIPIVVEGELHEVIPKELFFETDVVVDSDGKEVVVERAVEPLAANITAKNKKGCLKKLKAEFLRIAAAILGCGYDELYNREQRKKNRRIITACASVAAFLLCFGLYSGVMLYRINEQRILAEEMRSIAEEQRMLAEENLILAKENERVALIENSQSLARLSEMLWKSGDGIAAIQAAVEALPAKENERPFSVSAQRVLAEEIGAFSMKNFLPTVKLVHDETVKQVGFIKNGEIVVTKDETGIYFWDSKTGELKTKISEDVRLTDLVFEDEGIVEKSSVEKHAVEMVGMDEYKNFVGYQKVAMAEVSACPNDLYLFSDRGVTKVDGASGDELWHFEDGYNDYVITDEEIVLVNYYSSPNFKVYNKADGEFVCEYAFAAGLPGMSFPKLLYITDDKCFFTDEIYGKEIRVFDVENSEVRNPEVISIPLEEYVSSSVKCYGKYEEMLIFTVSLSDYFSNGKKTIIAMDAKTAQIKWSYDIEDATGNIADIGKLYATKTGSFCDVLYVASGDRMFLLNADTGELLHQHSVNGNILTAYHSLNGIVYLITDAGEELAFHLGGVTEDSDYRFRYVTRTFFSGFSICGYLNNTYAVSKDYSNEVILYSDVVNNSFNEVYSSEDYLTNKDFSVNEQGTHGLIVSYADDDYDKYRFYICDIESGAIDILATSEQADDFGFLDNSSVFVKCNDEISTYDINTKERTDSFTNNTQLMKSGKYLVFENRDESAFEIFGGSKKLKWAFGSDADTAFLRKYKLSDDGRIAAFVYCDFGYKAGNKMRLEVFDANTGSVKVLDNELFGSDLQIDRISFIGEKHIAVLLGKTVHLFDVSAGKLAGSASLETLPSVVSIVDIGREDEFCVLCNDSVLYRVSMSDGINNSIDIGDSTFAKVSSEYGRYEYIPEKDMLIIGTNARYECTAYFIDVSSFEVMYRIENFTCYNKVKNTVGIDEHYIYGVVPLYAAEELAAKANCYIK